MIPAREVLQLINAKDFDAKQKVGKELLDFFTPTPIAVEVIVEGMKRMDLPTFRNFASNAKETFQQYPKMDDGKNNMVNTSSALRILYILYNKDVIWLALAIYTAERRKEANEYLISYFK